MLILLSSREYFNEGRILDFKGKLVQVEKVVVITLNSLGI